MYLDVLKIMKRTLGDEHPTTLCVISSLAQVYDDAGRGDEAEARYLEALEVRRRVLGADHADTLKTGRYLADLYEKIGRQDAAESLRLELSDRDGGGTPPPGESRAERRLVTGRSTEPPDPGGRGDILPHRSTGVPDAHDFTGNERILVFVDRDSRAGREEGERQGCSDRRLDGRDLRGPGDRFERRACDARPAA